MPNGSTQTYEDRQNRTLEVWVNNPTATFEQIAAMANISDKTFWRYRKDPAFMARYKELCQARFKQLEAKAIHKLDKQLDEDNFQAIKYVLDGLGYKPTEKIDANVDSELTITVNIEE